MLTCLASVFGVDLWNDLPFGQPNMEEAFAEVFAVLATDPHEAVKRAPAWAALVKTVAI